MLTRTTRLLMHQYRLKTHARRSLPNTIIIGAQKAGTTHLFNLLAKHPEVAPSYKKEVHFFNDNYQRGLKWYRGFFPHPSARRPVVLESTPYYLFHPHAANRIAQTLPQARLIVLLRNPVSRAYSAYQHEVRRGRESLSFVDALAAEEQRLAGEEQRMVADPSYQSKPHRCSAYRTRGVYADQISRYLVSFPRESLLVLRSEDLFSKPEQTFSQVLDFLRLTDRPPATIPPSNSGGAYAPISAEAAAELAEFYEPHNLRLQELLGKNISWAKRDVAKRSSDLTTAKHLEGSQRA